MPFSPFITSLSLCGFTDKTTTSASWTAEALSVVALMPCFLFNSAPRGSRGPDAIISSGLANFLLSNPAIMASAITPGPINAIFFLSMVSSENRDRFCVPVVCQFQRFPGRGIHFLLKLRGILIVQDRLGKFILVDQLCWAGQIPHNIQLMIFKSHFAFCEFRQGRNID